MEKILIKNKIIIYVNKFIDEFEILYQKIINLDIPDYQKKQIFKDFADDLMNIQIYILNDNCNSFTYDFVTGYICNSCVFHKVMNKRCDLGDFENLIKLVPLSSQEKDKMFLKIKNLIKQTDLLESYQDLTMLKEHSYISNSAYKILIKIIDDIFFNFSNFIFSINSNIKKERINNLKNLVLKSRKIQDEISVPKEISQKLLELGYDVNSNSLSIQEPKELKKIISKNEKLINETNNKYIQDFIKVYEFLTNNKRIIEETIKISRSSNNNQDINNWLDLIINEIGSYNIIYLNAVTMIISISEKEFVNFYEIYNKFEKMGIFKTTFERELIGSLASIEEKISELNNNVILKLVLIEKQLKNIDSNLKNINANIHKQIASINNLGETILSSFNIFDERYNQISNNISHHLKIVNSNIGFNNLLQAVSAYQVYKLNK